MLCLTVRQEDIGSKCTPYCEEVGVAEVHRLDGCGIGKGLF
jgi:hypothetical protein